MKCVICRYRKIKAGKICRTCRSRIYRKNNPVRYAYQTLKDNAKRRQKEFYISFEDFKLFCNETNYINEKGIKATSLSIDRINNDIGYTYMNMQVLPLSDNTKKELVRFKILNGYYPQNL